MLNCQKTLTLKYSVKIRICQMFLEEKVNFTNSSRLLSLSLNLGKKKEGPVLLRTQPLRFCGNSVII